MKRDKQKAVMALARSVAARPLVVRNQPGQVAAVAQIERTDGRAEDRSKLN